MHGQSKYAMSIPNVARRITILAGPKFQTYTSLLTICSGTRAFLKTNKKICAKLPYESHA